MSLRSLLTALLVAPLAGGLAVIPANAGAFQLTSPTIKEGQPIGQEHFFNDFGCTGGNKRPVLSWSGAPKDTKSFAVTVYDQDAPTGSGFWHWVIYDIPANITTLDEKSIPAGAVEGNTDLGKPGFFGPCPPKPQSHRYLFTVHALKTEKLGAPAGATAALVGFFIWQNDLGQATLTGIGKQ
jgi:Raf kinase inhibitor-like YbhB/YbcL family protein